MRLRTAKAHAVAAIAAIAINQASDGSGRSTGVSTSQVSSVVGSQVGGTTTGGTGVTVTGGSGINGPPMPGVPMTGCCGGKLIVLANRFGSVRTGMLDRLAGTGSRHAPLGAAGL